MSLNEVIEDLENATITVQRTTAVARVNGVKQAGTVSTFTCIAGIQPAYNVNRVVGGADLHALVDGQRITDVRIFWTTVELRTREPAGNGFPAQEPDLIIGFEGANWTVIRVEKWSPPEEEGDDDTHFKSIVTKQTFGGG
jgi:hypothetical protein